MDPRTPLDFQPGFSMIFYRIQRKGHIEETSPIYLNCLMPWDFLEIWWLWEDIQPKIETVDGIRLDSELFLVPYIGKLWENYKELTENNRKL